MYLEGLGADILYTELFPLLNGYDLMCMYRALPKLQPFIESYKDWDRAYRIDFAADTVPTAGEGIARYFRRLGASVWSWGECQHYASTELDVPVGNYIGGMGSIMAPARNDLRAISQYLRNRCYKRLDGYFADPPLKWQTPAWLSCGAYDEFAHYKNTVFWRFASNEYIWHGPDDTVVMHVDTGYDRATILSRGLGVTEWRVNPFGEDNADTFETTKLQVAEEELPIPMIQVLSHKSIMANSDMVFLGEDGMVYKRSLSGHWLKTDLHQVHSIHPFAVRFKKVSDEVFSDSYGAVRSSGIVTLHKDGQLKFTKINSPGTPEVHALRGFSNIVKVVSRECALLALDAEGQVFFMGDTNKLNPGLGRTLEVDVCNDVEMAFENPQQVSRGREVVITDYPYIVRPRKVPLLGRVVDINVCMRECSAIVVQD